MSEYIPIIEIFDTSQTLAERVALWGNLTEVDRYDSANGSKYHELITVAREHVSRSLFAAALVSAWDAQAVQSPYNYGENIAKAVETAEKS